MGCQSGNGTFKPQLQITASEGQVSSMTTADLDGDGDAELIVGSFSAGRVSVYENRLREFATEIVPPAAGSYLLGQKLDAAVHFGFPVNVTVRPQSHSKLARKRFKRTFILDQEHRLLHFSTRFKERTPTSMGCNCLVCSFRSVVVRSSIPWVIRGFDIASLTFQWCDGQRQCTIYKLYFARRLCAWSEHRSGILLSVIQ